jgi:ABC-type transporter Mla subunit MlaD
MKDLREVLAEKEDELVFANDKVAELQATQNETHDQLEETLKNIERDHAGKEADLVAANREIEVVSEYFVPGMATYCKKFGQRVYELEETVEDLRAREQDLTADLRSADEAFENAKTHYENLVTALKDARKKLQGERDGALADVEAGVRERDALRRERADEIERHRKLLSDRELVSLTPVRRYP